MTTRIYLVLACIAGQTQAPRLIEAGTAAAARNHATRDMLTVKPASPKEVAKLIAGGAKLEIANEAPVEQQELLGAADGTTGGAGLGSSPELPDANLAEVKQAQDEVRDTVEADLKPAGFPFVDEGSRSTRARNRRTAAA